MGGRYDLESFLDDLQALCLLKLNDYIDRINADKADAIALPHFDSGDYYLQTLNTSTPNTNQFVLYGVETFVADSIGPGVAVGYKAFVVIVMNDPGIDPAVFRRLFRYQRVLLDLFREQWGNIGRAGVRPKVSGLNPMPVDGIGLKNALAAGVSLEFKME